MQSDLNWSKVKEDKVLYDKAQEDRITFFKAPEGDFEIVWLDEGVKGQPQEDRFNPGKQVTKVAFRIMYQNVEYKWEMNYSLSPKSTFYEVYEYATKNEGLKGKRTRIRCRGQGKERRITILS